MGNQQSQSSSSSSLSPVATASSTSPRKSSKEKTSPSHSPAVSPRDKLTAAPLHPTQPPQQITTKLTEVSLPRQDSEEIQEVIDQNKRRASLTKIPSIQNPSAGVSESLEQEQFQGDFNLYRIYDQNILIPPRINLFAQAEVEKDEEEDSKRSSTSSSDLETPNSTSHEDDSKIINIEPENTEMEGYLMKVPISRYQKLYSNKWQTRYFVLKESLLIYYNDIPSGSFVNMGKNLESHSQPVRLPNYTVGYGFSVDLTNAKTNQQQNFKFVASTTGERELFFSWFASPAPQERKAMLWAETLKRWKLIFIIIKQNNVEIFDRYERGSFTLRKAGTEMMVTEESLIFSITSPTKGTIHLKASNKEIFDQWVLAISQRLASLSSQPKAVKNRYVSEKQVVEFVSKVKAILKAQAAALQQRSKNPIYRFSQPRKKLFILSVDGGGMRGLMNCILLERVMEKYPSFLDRIDMVSGTSNGGMIAAGIAYGHLPSTSRALMEASGFDIFQKKSSAVSVAKFGNFFLKLLCEEIWGENKLKDAQKKLLIPALLLDNQAPKEEDRKLEIKLFHNLLATQSNSNPHKDSRSLTASSSSFSSHAASVPLINVADHYSSSPSASSGHAMLHASAPSIHSAERSYRTSSKASPMYNYDEDKQFLEERASDVVLRTVAAPTFFPSWQSYVDGGMFAHDPSTCCIAYCMSPNYLNLSPDDICLLSFGTGRNIHHFHSDSNHDWGYVQWVPKLATILWDGMIMGTEQLNAELLGERYCRIDPILPFEIPMDDPLQIPQLEDVAKKVDLSPVFAFLDSQIFNSTE